MPEARNRHRKKGNTSVQTADDIPLAQPSRDDRPAKTLIELATERSNEHWPDSARGTKPGAPPSVISTTIQPDGSVIYAPSEEDVVGPLGEAIFYAISLAIIHVTLDILVHNQFAESFGWPEIASRAVVALGTLILLVYVMHPRADAWWAQGVFLAGSVAAGCYLVAVSSKYSYMAVMTQAPPLGTLWIWSVIEQRVEVALVGLLLVGGYFWWGNYSIFA